MSSVRPSVRVESQSASSPVNPAAHAGFANDSHASTPAVSRRRNLTRRRLERIEASLSPRDLEVMAAVGMLRYVTTSQLQRLFFTSGTPGSQARLARLALHRLTGLRVVARLERRIGGVRSGSEGIVHTLDVAGQAILFAHGLKRRRRLPEPNLAFVRHGVMVAELCVRLHEAFRTGRLEAIEFEPEPDCWRPYLGPDGVRARLKPDAFVRAGRGHYEELAFIEVDLATESLPTIERKLLAYRRYAATGREQLRWDGVFPRVLWLAPSKPRLRKLLDVIAAQPAAARALFAVHLFDDAIEALTPRDDEESAS